jgi:hypothetical protein
MSRQSPPLRHACPACAAVVPAQVLPDRPEPYARLAKLYRTEQDDLERCYAYAVAGLAQGAPRADALFVDSNVRV